MVLLSSKYPYTIKPTFMEKGNVQNIARQLGSLGGKARAKKLTKKQRSEHAKKMVDAREAKRILLKQPLPEKEEGKIT